MRRGGSAGSISGFTFFLSREREIEKRTSRRGWGCLGVAGGVVGGGSGWQRAESEKRDCEVKWSRASRVFWKMVYGNFFRKLFSFFSSRFYGQIQTFSG